MKTNFDKIKAMDLDEMARYFDDWEFIIAIGKSVDEIKQWLQQEIKHEVD